MGREKKITAEVVAAGGPRLGKEIDRQYRSRRDFAEAAGISAPDLSRIVNGARMPSRNSVRAMCLALGVKPHPDRSLPVSEGRITQLMARVAELKDENARLRADGKHWKLKAERQRKRLDKLRDLATEVHG